MNAAPLPEMRRFFPQLEGMRAVASIGVLTTHVAFQTRTVELPVIGPILGRLDLMVALFFGLSGFLLWRPYVAAAHDYAANPSVPRYLRHRIVRIWPAYLVVVAVVLLLQPGAKTSDATVWLANITLTQVFVPLSLTAGLTQMWSLSVEVAFYALLPVLGYAMIRLRGGRVVLRSPVLIGLGLVSLGWAWFITAVGAPDGVEGKNWVFGYLPWFLAGLLLAELAGDVELTGGRSRWSRRLAGLAANRRLMLAVVVISYALSCTPIAGPTELEPLTNLEFATKMLLGGIFAFAVLAPLVCSGGPFRFLNSPVMLALGRWSYGIFIWHLAVLAAVFGLFGLPQFSGHFVLVLLLTLIPTIGISAASYAFIEEPLRRALVNWEKRRAASSATRLLRRSGAAGAPDPSANAEPHRSTPDSR